jgi:hypothetical protein
MSDRMALKIAIDLVHMPSQVRLFRSAPLPEGIETLLRIAAGDVETVNESVDLTGRSPDLVQQAATFFIEQILFAPNADSYRVLGAHPKASPVDLRRNTALLLRWLHPDLDSKGERSLYVRRVTAAWNDLKTSERRGTYDEQLRRSDERARHKKAKSRINRNGSIANSGAPARRQNGLSGASRRGDDMSFFRRALSVLFFRTQF